MNTTVQLPSQAGTTLITWVATLNIVWVLGLLVAPPAAIKATRSSNRRKAALRHAAARTAPVQYQAPAAR